MVDDQGLAITPLEDRPLVTFALFAYNQENYIREAVEGALAQTYSPLEIILSDDCSTDQTFEIIKEMSLKYNGKHQVIINKNPINQGQNGIGEHVNKIIELSRGDLVVFSAGDDISSPKRVELIVDIWKNAGCPHGSIHSAVNIISSSGGLITESKHGKANFDSQSIEECIKNGGSGVLGATHAITRSVYNYFGPLPHATVFEDRSLAFRSLLLGKVLYCDKPLVKYRLHEDNFTNILNFTDDYRWKRWVNGHKVCYQSFLADYEKFIPLENRDLKVVSKINKKIKNLEKSLKLVSGTMSERVLSAIYYTSGQSFRSKISLIARSFIHSSIFLGRVATWSIQYREKRFGHRNKQHITPEHISK